MGEKCQNDMNIIVSIITAGAHNPLSKQGQCQWHPKKDGFKVSALTSPPTRLEPFSDAD